MAQTGLEQMVNAGAHDYYRNVIGGNIPQAVKYANSVSGGGSLAQDAWASQTGGLNDYLNSILGEGDMPAGAMGNIASQIGRVTDRNVNALRENSAQTGFGGVVDPNAINSAYAGEQGALGNAELDLLKTQYARKSDAVASLLGLASGGQGALAQDRQTQLAQFQAFQGSADQRRALQAQIDAQPSGVGQVIGEVLSAGATIAGIFSDRKLKEKIRYTGETHDGLPVAEFCYKGSNDRYRGFIAQDIEEARPDCVTIFADGHGGEVRTVDYNRLNFKFGKV